MVKRREHISTIQKGDGGQTMAAGSGRLELAGPVHGTRTAEFVPMHVLQKWMGHKDISTTVRYYLGVPDRYAEIARQAS